MLRRSAGGRSSVAELRTIDSSPSLDLKEVFVSGRWREAVLLTYSFDLPFFEAYLLPTMVRNGCRSIAVAACSQRLSERLHEWIDAQEVREAGRSYTLTGGQVPGAFHPKLLLAVGEDGGAVLVGSGNISAFGMASGGELFVLERWRGSEVPDLARDAWRTCREVSRQLLGETLFAARVDALATLAPALALPPATRHLWSNLGEPLLSQLERAIGGRRVDELLLWSPFWDRRLEALAALAERLCPRRITIAVQPDLTSIDGVRLGELIGNRPEIEWQVIALTTQAGQGGARAGLVHAKGILATLTSGQEVLMTGSPNISVPALIRIASEANLELAVAQESPGLRLTLFGDDSYVTLCQPVDSDRLTWIESHEAALETHPASTISLIEARLEGGTLRLIVQGALPDGAAALLDSALEFPLLRAGQAWVVELGNELSPRVVQLTWPDGRSNAAIVADIGRLAALARGRDATRHTDLEALDYGEDTEILALLDELAQLTLISVHDIGRLLKGRTTPTEHEEQTEAEGRGEPVELGDIDFDAVRQHPRAAAYESNRADGFEIPRIQLWLDEIVRQFDALRDHQLREVVKPVPTDEGEDEPEHPNETMERQRWPVSRRIRTRVRNRLQRYVDGLVHPRLWSLVPADWMAKNYVVFLSLVGRLWDRTADTRTEILPAADLAPLGIRLLTGFWGDDQHHGYWEQLSEDDALATALFFIDHHTDALTMALASRVLATAGPSARTAPFAVAGFVRAVQGLGFLAEDTAERALVYLGSPDRNPQDLIKQHNDALTYFVWDRYLAPLARRYGIRALSVQQRGFTTGAALVVQADVSYDKHPNPLDVFADWIVLESQRHPRRLVFQMLWNSDDCVFIYDAEEQQVMLRRQANSRWVFEPIGSGLSHTEAAHPGAGMIEKLARQLPG